MMCMMSTISWCASQQFLFVRKDVQLQGRSKTEERAENMDYCLLLLVEVQPPKEVEDCLAACR